MVPTTGIQFGTDASCSGPAPGLFNAFSVSITQGITQAVGFGDTWMRTRGTVGGISGSMSGFVESGTNSTPASVISGIGVNHTGGTCTFTFATSGDSISFIGVTTGLGFNVQYLGNQTLAVSVTGDGSPTVAWTF